VTGVEGCCDGKFVGLGVSDLVGDVVGAGNVGAVGIRASVAVGYSLCFCVGAAVCKGDPKSIGANTEGVTVGVAVGTNDGQFVVG
jgi:hypothetical protein